MDGRALYLIAADAILLVHVLFVLFILFGLVLIYLGRWRGWRWVRHFWFRVAHLAAIGYVVAQAWLGEICPLTIWETDLRLRAGDATYDGAFIAHWLQTLLYYQAPIWVFTLIYTLFGLLVCASWWWVPPKR